MKSKYANGERCCICGEPADLKIGEERLPDHPLPFGHNLTQYVCEEHFNAILKPYNNPGYWKVKAVQPDVMEPNTYFGITDERMMFLVEHMKQVVKNNTINIGNDPSKWSKVDDLVNICAPCRTANEIAMQVHTYCISLRQIQDILIKHQSDHN